MKMNYFIPGGKRTMHLKDARFANGGADGGGSDWPADEEDEDVTTDDSESESDESDDNDDDVKEQRNALMQEIRKNVDTQMKKQGLSNSASKQVRSLIDASLEKMEVPSLQSFKGIEKTVRSLSNMVDKLKNQPNAQEKRNQLQIALAEKMPDIAKAVRNKDRREVRISLNTRVAAIMTTQNVITTEVAEVEPGLIDSFSFDGFVPKRYGRQYVSDIADVETVNDIAGTKIWWEEGNEEGAFAIVAEGALKPLVSFDLVENQHKIRKAAGKMVFTEEVEKFRPRAYSIIRQLFTEKVYRDYQRILAADLLAAAATYAGGPMDGTVANPTDYHAIGAVAGQIEALNFSPDVLIINPQDKWRIALSTGTDGHFFVPPMPITGPDGITTMLGFRVVISTEIPVGTFILGEQGLYRVEQSPIEIRIGYGLSMNGTTPEHDFDHNRFRIIGEVFFHNYIASNNEGSFVQGNFAAIKTALAGGTT